MLSEFGEEDNDGCLVLYTGVFMVKFEQDVNDLSKFWYCALSLTQRLERVATHTHHIGGEEELLD